MLENVRGRYMTCTLLNNNDIYFHTDQNVLDSEINKLREGLKEKVAILHEMEGRHEGSLSS